ncbi:MAG: ABC transporter ATP-binding protein [Candidatus Hydrogenedentota bacterium]
MSEPVARLEDVSKIYHLGAVDVHALRHVSIDVQQGEYVSIMGPSGCGKSTLLNVVGCLDQPTRGAYYLGGTNVAVCDDDTLSEIRGRRLGFIFQSYNLIPQLTVLENIEVPLQYQGVYEEEARARAIALAQRVGLGDRLHHRPLELSGGQQQRVGIARSLANDPLVLIADEPTGNLDSQSGADILDLFDELHAQGKTLVLVTHDDEISRRSQRIIRLLDGAVESDVRN